MLTKREKEVLLLVKEGCTNKEIAGLLCISQHTSKAHVASIIHKMNVKNRLQAALYADEYL